MNFLHAPVTDIDNPTPVLALLGKAARSYSRFFIESALAERLSPTRSVRRVGFDTRLDVVRVCPVATDVVAITLARPDRSPLPRWTPGAHLDVFSPSGRQRHYSLTGDRFDPVHYTIAVRRIPGGAGSAELHALSVGDVLYVRGPRNAFNLAPAADYLFVAGGIGITPIAPMLREVARSGASWRLIYAGRTRESMPFVEDLVVLGRDRVAILPDDECGTSDLRVLFSGITDSTAVYVCGPPTMIDSARASVREVSQTVEFHSERFSPQPVVGGREFSVVLGRTGTTVTVGADEPALDAIRRVRPQVRYSCRQGFCGTCRVKVIEGEVEHRDRVLIGDERDDSMMICVSRAAADSLVIDL